MNTDEFYKELRYQRNRNLENRNSNLQQSCVVKYTVPNRLKFLFCVPYSFDCSQYHYTYIKYLIKISNLCVCYFNKFWIFYYCTFIMLKSVNHIWHVSKICLINFSSFIWVYLFALHFLQLTLIILLVKLIFFIRVINF